MPRQKVVQLASNDPVIVTFVGASPHVVAYRLWSRPSAEAPWSAPRDGNTRDNVPDVIDLGPLGAGAEILYWLGIGGNPGSSFRALVTLDQGGRRLVGGTCVEEGVTDANGFAQTMLQIILAA